MKKRSSGDNNFSGRNNERVTINDKREKIDNIVLSDAQEAIKELKPTLGKNKKPRYIRNIMIAVSLIVVISFGLLGVYTLTDLFIPKSLQLKDEKIQGISGQEIDVEVYIKPYLISYRLESEDTGIAYVKDNKLFAKSAGITNVMVYSQRGSLVDTITVKVLDKNNRFDYNIDFDIESDDKIIVENIDDYKDQTVISGRLSKKIPNPYKIGYEFVGWYKDAEYAKKFSFDDPIVNDLKLYPRWKVIDVHFGNGEAIALKSAKYKEDYLISLNKYVSGGSLEGAPEGSDNLGDFEFSLSKSHFEKAENKLPLGLTLMSNGTINGYPLETGEFSFVVKVLDKINNSFEEAEFKITVDKQIVSLNYESFKNIVYDGKPIDQTVKVENNYINLYVTDNIIAKVILNNPNDPFNKNAGSYTVTVIGLEGKGSENYDLPKTNLSYNFTVEQKTAEIEFFSDDKDNNKNFALTYSGQIRSLRAVIINLCENDTSEVLLSYDKDEVADYGEYTATVSALSNANYKFSGTIVQKFNIAKATAFLSVTVGQKKIYGEKDNSISYTLIDSQGFLSSTEIAVIKGYINEKLVREQGENVGEYKYTMEKEYGDPRISNIVLSDNLSDSELTFNILQREIEIEGIISKIYDKDYSVNTVNLKFKDGGKVNNDLIGFAGVYESNETGKDIKVKFSLTNNENGNYKLIGSYKGEILKKEVEISFSNINETYDGTEKNINITVSNGLCEDDIANITVAYDNNDRINTGTFIATAINIDNDNYKLPSVVSKEYTIVKREVTIKSNEVNFTKIYDGTTDVTFTLNNKVDNYYQFENVINGELLYLYGFKANFDSKDVVSASKITLSELSLSADVRNYKLITETFDIPSSITPKDITVRGQGQIVKTFDNNKSVIFNGTDSFENYYLFENLIKGERLVLSEFDLEYNDNGTTADIVTAAAIAIDNKNYNLITENFEIDAKILPLETEVIWTEDNFIYNGKNQKDNIIAKYFDIDNNEIILTISAGEFKDYGEYSFSASFANGEINYKLISNIKTYNIKKAFLTLTADDKTITYGDSSPQFTFTLTDGSYLNEEDENDVINNISLSSAYDTKITENRNVGDYTIEISYSNSNYDITLENGTLKVEKYSITLSADNKTATYGDEDIAFTYSVTELLYEEDNSVLGIISFLTNYDKTTPANSDGIIVTPNALINANYDIKYINGDITINKKDITVTFSGYDGLIYNGAEREITAVFNGLVNSDTVMPILTVTDGKVIKNADSYTITAANDNENYNLTETTSVNFSIAKAEITLTADNKTITYGEGAPSYTYSVTSGAYQNAEDETAFINGAVLSSTYNISDSANRNAKDYEIELTYENGNYDITVIKGKLTVNKKDITVTFSGHDGLIYNGAEREITSVFNGLVNSDTVTPMLTVTDGKIIKNADRYTITASNDNENYNLTETTIVNFSIAKAEITLTADNKTITYGECAPSYTYSVTSGAYQNAEDETAFINGAALISTYNISDSANRNAKDYEIELTYENGNYDITVIKGKLTVNKKDITVTFSGYDGLIYNGAEREITALFNGLVNSDTVMPILTVSDGKILKNADSYTITASNDNENYNLTETTSVTFSIAKAQATVTAISASKLYGEENPLLDVAKSGFFEDFEFETLSSATNISEPGDYDLVVTRQELTNYDITYIENDKLTVNKRDIANTSVNDIEEVTYNGSELEPQFSITETLSHLSLADTDYTFSYSNNINAGINSGVITITAMGTRYTGTKVVYFTINKKAASLTAEDITLQYGEESPSLNVIAVGFIENYTFEATTTREQGSGVGEYAITISEREELSNYDITYNHKTFTVIPRVLTVTKANNDYIYNGLQQEMTVSLDNIYNNDDVGLVLSYKIDDKKVDAVRVNTYSVEVSFTNPNYTSADKLFSHTISKRKLTVTAKAASREYGKKYIYDENSYTLNNLIDGDDVTFELVSLDADKSFAKSTFDINLNTQSGLDISQYDVEYVKATLTIVPKTVSLSIKEDVNNLTEIYKDGILTQVPITIYPVGMLEGDKVAIIYEAFHENDPETACQIIKAGQYNIKAKVSNNPNYIVSDKDPYLDFTVTVKPYTA